MHSNQKNPHLSIKKNEKRKQDLNNYRQNLGKNWKMKGLPRSVKFDDDKVVLTNGVSKVRVIQSQHELFRFTLFG